MNLDSTTPDGGAVLQFNAGSQPHTRQLPRLTRGPFKYARYAGEYTKRCVNVAEEPAETAR